MWQTSRKIVLASAFVVLACSNGQACGQPAAANAQPSFFATAAAIPLTGRVTDAAKILSQRQAAILSDKLARLERETKHQMVIVTAPSLGGRDIDDFTKDLSNRCGIGRKGYNDGVVILIAPLEKKVRITVGYGLEKRLSNDARHTIIVQDMLPRFRQGDLFGGISAGTDLLIKLLQ
jgi:uncharacterized protein